MVKIRGWETRQHNFSIHRCERIRTEQGGQGSEDENKAPGMRAIYGIASVGLMID